MDQIKQNELKELSNQTKKDEMIYFILIDIDHGHLISRQAATNFLNFTSEFIVTYAVTSLTLNIYFYFLYF